MNKSLVKSRFARSRQSYECHANMQKQIAKELAEKAFKYLPRSCDSLIEIGCGTGFLTREIFLRISIKKLWLNDLVDNFHENMTETLDKISQVTKLMLIPGDAEQITFPEKVEVITSSSTLQWMNDLPAFFNKAYYTLNNNGLFIFNTFGPNNFHEMKSLTGAGLHYPNIVELQKQLEPYFEIIEMWEEVNVCHFNHPREVLHHLQATGVTASSNHFQWTKKKLNEFETSYLEQFNEDNMVTLTWEVYYFICKKKRR